MKRDPPKLFARQKNKLQDFRKRRVTTSRDVDATRESFDSEIEAVARSVLNRTPKISAIYQRTTFITQKKKEKKKNNMGLGCNNRADFKILR